MAGMVDGEGYLGLLRHNRKDRKQYMYRPVLAITSTDKEVIEWMKNSFGGYIGVRKDTRNTGRKTTYDWKICDTGMRWFLLKIKPYLRIKKERAELLNQIIKRIIWWKENRKGVKNSDEYWKEMDILYWQLRKLNKKGFVQAKRLNEATRKGSDSLNSTE